MDSAATGRKKRHWAALKVVFKSQALSEFERRLERAKNLLGLAVEIYSMSLNRHQTSMLIAIMDSRKTAMKEVEETNLERQVNTSKASEAGLILRRSTSMTTVKTKWYGVGWLQTIRKISERHLPQSAGFSSNQELEVDWKFQPAAWISSKGFSITQNRESGQWKYCFAPICVVPDSSPIFEACRLGNLKEVIKLIQDRKGTVFDVSEKGWSLLHIAAGHLRPDICRWLITQGARGDAVDIEWGRTPLHIAANQSGRDLGWNRYGGFMKAIDNVRRPSDAIDTFRVLVEEGQCDPIAKTPSNTPEHLYGSQTVLHLHTGSIAAFQYLLNQEHFIIDMSVQNEMGMTPAIDQLFAGWPTSSELARLSIQYSRNSNILSATQRYKSLSNMTNLHMAVDRLRYHEVKMSEGSDRIREIIGLTISDLLGLGAHVHATDDFGRTPLHYLCQRTYQEHASTLRFRKLRGTDSSEDLCARLMLWFTLLSKAGFDLQDYIRKEFELNEKAPKDLLERYLWSTRDLAGPYEEGTRRKMEVEILQGTSDIIFSVEDVSAENQLEQGDGSEPVIPGAWDLAFDSAKMEELLEVEPWASVSILIKPVEAGRQEFTVRHQGLEKEDISHKLRDFH